MRVYLDCNATSPLRPEARAAMLAALEAPANPSSVHAEGRRARLLRRNNLEAHPTQGRIIGHQQFIESANRFDGEAVDAGMLAREKPAIDDDLVHRMMMVLVVECPMTPDCSSRIACV